MQRDKLLYAQIYKLLLLTYPRQHRQEYGTEMQLLFGEMMAERPTSVARLRVFGRVTADTLAWSPRERQLLSRDSMALLLALAVWVVLAIY